MVKRNLLIAGGDKRQIYLANLMSADHTVCAVGFDGGGMNEAPALCADVRLLHSLSEIACKPDIIILPVPSSVDNEHINMPLSDIPMRIEDVLEISKKATEILAGKPCDTLVKLCARKKLRLTDYMEREELAVLNAVPTAEGAVGIALNRLDRTLFGAECLVTGFGRIAKTLTRILCGFGAKVSVAARRQSDFAWIKIYGATPLHTKNMGDTLKKADVVFNTVPAVIMDYDALRRLKKGALLIDLASKPGGVDFNAAQRLQVETIWALSLPGKSAPESAGEIIKDTIDNILSEIEEEE